MLKTTFTVFMLFSMINLLSSSQEIELAYVNFPPYEYQENGQAKGLLVDIVKMIFEEAEIDIKLHFLPFARAFNQVQTGNLDGIFNFYKTEERMKTFDFSEPIIDNPLVFFVRKDSNLNFSSLEDLKSLKIGTMRGYTYGTEFDTSDLFRRHSVNSHESNFKMLIRGRIDAYPVDKLVGIYIANKKNILGDLKILPEPLNIMKGRIGFTKNKHTELIAKINSIIEKMHADGVIDKIINDYVEAMGFSRFLENEQGILYYKGSPESICDI